MKSIEIEENGIFRINDKVGITNVEEDAFRYVGENWNAENTFRMKFSNIEGFQNVSTM
ncbi:MAG: hypothetical protein R2728_00720 [Chitinophagales bacterium]